jgi:hypothetical protein
LKLKRFIISTETYYFSGTGNSLIVTRDIAGKTTVLLLKNVCRAIQMQQEEREREGTF